MTNDSRPMPRVFTLPVELLVPRAPIPAGMSIITLCAIAQTLRNSNHPIDAIEVTRAGRRWDIIDGRHRWLAHWVAGRDRIRCFTRDERRHEEAERTADAYANAERTFGADVLARHPASTPASTPAAGPPDARTPRLAMRDAAAMPWWPATSWPRGTKG